MSKVGADVRGQISGHLTCLGGTAATSFEHPVKLILNDAGALRSPLMDEARMGSSGDRMIHCITEKIFSKYRLSYFRNYSTD